MKIDVLTDVATRRAGGVFNAVSDMFTNAAFKDVDVRILSYYDDMIKEDLPAWKGIPMKLYHPHFFLYSKELKKDLMKSDSEIHHQEGLWRYSHLLMGKIRGASNKPIICTPHGMLDPYIIREQGKIKRLISDLFFQKSLESVTCYQALCQKELEDIREYGLKQPIAIIPNGINLPDISVKYEKSDDKKHLLFLGRLHEKKGVDMLLSAFANLIKEKSEMVKDWHIDLVGWDHENCRAKLEKIVKDNKIEDYITFHGGVYGEDKIRMYSTCDAYILPSHGEGLPMTVLEAWSWRKPALITPHCHLPEGYEAKAALKIEDNVESIQEGLLKLFDMDKEELSIMGDNAYNLVKEKFTWDAAAKNMLMLYEWVLGRGEKPEFVFEYGRV